LGEFSPIGQLFALGSFLKITESALIFALLYPIEKKYINCDKNGGKHFGRLFQINSHLVTLIEYFVNATA
jgi:hypothetical protein